MNENWSLPSTPTDSACAAPISETHQILWPDLGFQPQNYFTHTTLFFNNWKQHMSSRDRIESQTLTAVTAVYRNLWLIRFCQSVNLCSHVNAERERAHKLTSLKSKAEKHSVWRFYRFNQDNVLCKHITISYTQTSAKSPLFLPWIPQLVLVGSTCSNLASNHWHKIYGDNEVTNEAKLATMSHTKAQNI